MAERLSDLADALWPHLARRVAQATGGAAALNVASPTDHGALTGLLDDDHPQYLTVGRGDGRYPALTDWTTHIGNADAHHARLHVLATNAGLGADHTISGAAAGHVLRASSATAAAFAQLAHSDLSAIGTNTHTQIDTHIANSDIHVAHSGVSMSAGDGLTGGGTIAATRSFAVALSAVSGLELTGTSPNKTLQLADSVAGAGLTTNNKVLSVGVSGLGLSVGADAVTLTSSSNPGAAASILASDATGKLTLPLLVASSSVTTPLVTAGAGQSLMLQAPQDLILSPGTNLAKLAAGKHLQSETFTSGFAGAGWRIEQGALTAAEVDNLTVRGTMRVYELLIQQIRATNGSVFVSSSAKLEAVTLVSGSTYDCTTDGSAADYQPFAVGDVLRAQRVNLGSGTLVWRSDLVVTAINVGGNARTFRATLQGGTTAPAAGMEFVRLGNTSDVARQGAVYLTADDSGAPFIDVVAGIAAHADWNTAGKVKTRLGRLDGIFGQTDEFGLWAGTGVTAADRYIRASSAALELRNVPLALFDGSANTLLLSPGDSNRSPFLAMGSPLPTTPITNDGVWLGLDEATTNYIQNPSFEAGTGGYWQYYASPTVAQGGDALYGAYSLSMTTGATANPYFYRENIAGGALAQNQTWTFSAWVKAGNAGAVGKTVKIRLRENGSLTTAATATLTTAWQRVSVTRTLTEATPTTLNHYIQITSSAGSGDVLLVDGVQLEQLAYPTPYCDGSLGDGHAWSGTAHASSSSRAGGYKLRVGTVANGVLQRGLLWDGANLVWKAANTSLDASGNLTASNATLSGQVTATSGSIAGALIIGTDGGIYQGTGTFASPTTGLKIWNDSGVGRIGGYNAGALQWYAGTDGKLYAGGGSVWIDTNGLNANIALAGSDVKFWGGLGTQVGAISGFSDLDAHLYIYALHSAKTTDLRVGVSNSTSPNYLTSITFTDTEALLDAPKITVSAASQGTWFVGHVYPNADLTYNLGSASKRWGTVYANNMVISGAISGETLGGAEWEYAGSMVIDANAASNTTVSIVNQNASYTASLDVEGNITLGGLVDGVDLAAFKTAYDSHNHDGRYYTETELQTSGSASVHWGNVTNKPATFAPAAHALVGSDHTASGLSAGHVVRASGPTTFAWAQLAHSDLSGVGTNTHTQIDSHIAATAAHGVSGAIVGTTDSQTLSNKTLTTPTIASFANAQHAHTNAASGGTIAHGSLTGIGANDHHSQAHVLASTSGLGADHTVAGLTARQVLRATGATTAAFGAIEDADLPSTIVRTSRQIIAGNGLTGGGALSADVTVTMGTPSSLTATSTNAVTSTSHTHAITTGAAVGLSVSSTSTEGGGTAIARADHTHAITSSSNPGEAASILASDASGYLRLIRLGLGVAPTVALEVSGAAGQPGIVVQRRTLQPSIKAGSSDGFMIIDSSGTNLRLNNYVADDVWIASGGGNVGIGLSVSPSFKLHVAGAASFADATITNLTATRLVASDASDKLVSTSLNSWMTGTANRVTVADDGDGTVTLSAPQDIHTGASPTFVGATLTGLTATRLVASNGSDALVSVTDLTTWVAGTANRVTVANDGDGTITLSAPQDIHTSATPTFGGLIAPWLRPASDSTTAVQIRNASGGAVLTVDTTNSRLGIGTTSPSYKLDVSGDIRTTGALYADGGIVDFGTNYFQEGATYLELKGAKPFYLNQTIQASGWSMSAGGALVSASSLSAASMALTGAATIAGNLTVGGTVLQVSAAGTRIGINRAADQQFDLDVAGAIRGQYLVGPHALQLSDAKAIVHFDGPAPYNLDFSGTSTTHMGENATETGGVIYRPGKFGKAVQLAEATTNLVANPSFEADAIGATTFTGWNLWGSPPTREITAGGLYGEKCLRLITNGTNQGVRMGHTVTSGTTYTISFYVYVITGRPVIYMNGTGVSTFGAELPSGWTGNNLWNRYSYTFTATANGTCNIYLGQSAGGVNGEYLLDGVQFEQKAYATPYCDGSLGAGHSWSGTAHASTSSRTGASLAYPGLIPSGSWTVGWWQRLAQSAFVSSVWNGMFVINGEGGANSFYGGWYGTGWHIIGQAYDAGSRTFQPSGIGSTYLQPGEWYFVTLAYDDTAKTCNMYFGFPNAPDGSQFASYSYSFGSGLNFSSGNFYLSNASKSIDVDELFILSTVADAKLIRSIYESNAPVFAESSVVSFRAPTKSQIWVDEFGFWAKGQSGGEAFGIFGGDPRRLTTTKSWGGVTMEENDIVIGRTSAPSYTALHWDDSAGELILGRQAAEHLSLVSGAVRIKNATTVYADLTGSTFILGNASEENLRLTTSGIEFRNATEVQGSLSGTSWTLGKTGTGENNVQITPTTLSLRSGANKHAELTSAGVLTLGLTSSGDYVTIDGTNGVRLYGNSSLLGQWTAAGGVVIGTVANSTSRIEIASGAVNIINRSAGGADDTVISLSSSGSATFTGQITATTGAVGGWTIGATSLTSGSGGTTVGIDSGGTNPAFYAGSATPASAPFRVTNAGVLTATSGTVGGWTLGASSLTGGSATLSNTGKLTLGTSNNVLIADAADANYRLYIGHATPASAPFSVTKTGGLTSSLGLIGGWTITSDRFQGGADARLYSTGKMALGSIYGMVVIDPNHADWRIWSGVAADIESNPLSSQFRVSKQGQLTASGATIYGHIVANSGDIAGVLTVGASGGIYQGTGSFASPTTGLKIWNDSGVGRIGGYNAGALQWYAGTDGKLYAGGGNVRLDAGGVAVAAPTTYYSAANAFGFTRAGVAVGGLLALATASETAMVIGANTVDASAGNPVAAESNRDARVAIWAKAQGTGKHAALELKALAGDGVNSAQITMGTNASPWLQLSATTITLDGNVECAYEVDFGSWCRVAKLVVDGDPGGVSTGEIALSNQTSDVSTGVGTVKMGGASNANSTGWLKIYVAGNARYIPFWSVIAG